MNIEPLDLRSITRHSDLFRGNIYLIDDYKPVLWIQCGEMRIQNERNCFVSAYLKDGATDFEHDSAMAFRISLIGLSFKYAVGHTCIFEAWIDPKDPSDFRVPNPGYTPSDLEGATICKSCEEPHLIVPEGHYLPPPNEKLFKDLRGVKVEINMGPNWEALDED